jgi:hypothetical protein
LSSIGDPRAADLLIIALKDSDPTIRSNAANALSRSRIDMRERVVDPLAAALDDESGQVRWDAARALQEIGFIDPLIAALKEEDTQLRFNAVRALGMRLSHLSVLYPGNDEISRILASLTVALEDEDAWVRGEAVEALDTDSVRASRRRHPAAERTFMATLMDRDLALIRAAYKTFIGVGQPGTENAMIDALNSLGDKDMAESFLRSGNGSLAAAARSWARTNGYEIVESSPYVSTVRWGSRR